MGKNYNYPDRTPSQKPDIKVSVYGSNAPDAAKFGVGTSTRQGVEEAAQARRDNQAPGNIGRKD
jgi:hypothetical protein